MRKLRWSDIKSSSGRRRILDRIWRYGTKRWVIGDYKGGGIKGLYHWIRCHVWNRYHIIDISGEDNYQWGWLDRDQALLLANFKILRDFVELENVGVGLRDVEAYIGDAGDEYMRGAIEAQVEREREIRALYVWWTETRAIDEALAQAIIDSPVGDRSENGRLWVEATDRLYDKEQEMLIRLIKVRGALWT